MVQTSKNPLLDPGHLASIEDLSLLSRVVVEGNHFGAHRSRRQGHGNEFFQYRAYEPSEDLKSVDWKVFAKTGELVSRTYQESTNSNLMIVLDASASMDYQGENSDCSKFRYAQMLASCLLYLGHRQGDRIGLFGGSDHFQEWMFPRSGRESFKSILACVGGMKPRGADLDDLLWDKFKNKLPRQATVVVISDFLEGEDQLFDRLGFARSSRYACICLQILDPLEEVLPDAEAIRFMEMEGEGEVSVSPERIRSDYKGRMVEHIEKLGTVLARTGAEFCTLRTNQELGLGIRRFLGMRTAKK